jgi:hypothetical protein
MLSPFDFLDRIKHTEHPTARLAMAEFALNLYYGPADHPFDVSRLFDLVTGDRLACMGALAWAFSQPQWKEPRTYILGGGNYLDSHTKSWLVGVADRARALCETA